MYFTSGSDQAFEQLMQGKPGFDHYHSGEYETSLTTPRHSPVLPNQLIHIVYEILVLFNF